jgi:small subunit ribosomal protein S7
LQAALEKAEVAVASGLSGQIYRVSGVFLFVDKTPDADEVRKDRSASTEALKGIEMPRRREVPKREILPDPKFGSVDLSKFMNVIMESGKKAVAERIIYGALEQVEKKAGKDPLEIFNVALNNIKPVVEVKSRRVGGANYQVPVEVRPSRRIALAMRWLKESSRKRSEKSMAQRLANELLEAAEGRGGAMKKRDEVHRMAEANKAFSHFRF